MSWLQINEAVCWGIGQKVVQTFGVIVVTAAVLMRLSAVEQGYYYTFYHVLAFQVFAELGLGMVITQFASHEWAHLSLDGGREINGDRRAHSRLASLFRLAAFWYGIVGVLATLALILYGGAVFGKTDEGVQWQCPWLATCLVNGLLLWLIPFWAVLDGCNQVNYTYRFRCIEGAIGVVVLCGALLLHAGLWASPLSLVAKLIYGVWFLSWRYRRFFFNLMRVRPAERVGWRSEILGLQWRFAVSWIGGYFGFYVFTPVAFHYHGALLAGQLGMTIMLTSGVMSTAQTWVTVNAPAFGVLAAQRKWEELDSMMFRIAKVAYLIAVAGALLLVVSLKLVSTYEPRIAARVLPAPTASLFVSAALCNFLTLPLSTYLRAHKREPYVLLSTASGALIGVLTYVLGRPFGAVGIGAAYLGVSGLVTAPWGVWIWSRSRAEWHQPPKQDVRVATLVRQQVTQ